MQKCSPTSYTFYLKFKVKWVLEILPHVTVWHLFKAQGQGDCRNSCQRYTFCNLNYVQKLRVCAYIRGLQKLLPRSYAMYLFKAQGHADCRNFCQCFKMIAEILVIIIIFVFYDPLAGSKILYRKRLFSNLETYGALVFILKSFNIFIHMF